MLCTFTQITLSPQWGKSDDPNLVHLNNNHIAMFAAGFIRYQSVIQMVERLRPISSEAAAGVPRKYQQVSLISVPQMLQPAIYSGR